MSGVLVIGDGNIRGGVGVGVVLGAGGADWRSIQMCSETVEEKKGPVLLFLVLFRRLRVARSLP